MKLTLKTKRANRVGSSDVLGIVGVIPINLLLGGMLLGECAVLYICMSILIEHYREKKQNRRQNSNSPSKPNQCGSLSLHLAGRLRLLLGNQCRKLGKITKLNRDIRRPQLLLHPADNLGNLGVHKSENATMPNDQELSHATRDSQTL